MLECFPLRHSAVNPLLELNYPHASPLPALNSRRRLMIKWIARIHKNFILSISFFFSSLFLLQERYASSDFLIILLHIGSSFFGSRFAQKSEIRDKWLKFQAQNWNMRIVYEHTFQSINW